MFELLPGYDEAPMSKLAIQIPSFRYGPPLVPDLNNDGVMDLYHHNHFLSFHYETNRWSNPSMSAVGDKPGGCMADWDAAIRSGSNGTYYPVNKGKGFMKMSDSVYSNDAQCFDSHSSAFLDIDGDGIKDFFQVTGGGHGVGNSKDFDNILYWGQKDKNSELGYRLVGGRDAAFKAGLHGRNRDGNQRGRHHYWFDADGDGLLDVVTLTVERKDDKVIPGLFYRNINGRVFNATSSPTRNFQEFAGVALLTDLDGDGYAKELIVSSQCKPDSKNRICNNFPRLSRSVYEFDSKEDNLQRRTLAQEVPNGVRDYYRANGIGSQDFDLDGLPDVAILYKTRVDFYLSSTRQGRCKRFLDDDERRFCLLFMGDADSHLDLSPMCGKEGAAGFRFADFNLNGKIDMLVVCSNRPGRHGIYELESKNTWRRLKDFNGKNMNYGDLNSLNYGFGPKNYCKGIPTTRKDTTKNISCESYLPASVCRGLKNKNQVAICSIFKHQRDYIRALAPTVADLDNDGYRDVILAYTPGSIVIFRNTLGDMKQNRNRFFAISFAKKASPSASIGAILQLTSSGMGPKNNGTVTQLRVVSTQSHETDAEGGSDDRVVFGLGKNGIPERLEIKWPHCCDSTIIWRGQLKQFLNSMDSPYEVSAPAKNCDKSCFNRD